MKVDAPPLDAERREGAAKAAPDNLPVEKIEERLEAIREAYEERAAILEYDAPDYFPTREAAEAEARRLTGYDGW